MPYDYQARLAALPCESRLINIPTGLGKTAAVVLAWLYNRVHLQDAKWLRRLVYCLPMRTLVEQTASEAQKWIDALHLAGHIPEKPRAVILMGGEDATDWDLYPEANTILIGTQDMLLSRALNRGYGMSRYRWPMHFGLLNNDALWVMDETQLMGVGVETSAQLNGFRSLWKLANPSPTWWMSATLDENRLATVDHACPSSGWPRLKLGNEDEVKAQPRLEAIKNLNKAPLSLTKSNKDTYAKELAAFVLDKHVSDHLTLVIVNRVGRAQDLYSALKKAGRIESIALVHSRFRGTDRQTQQDILLKGTGDRIVIATQAVEAGVDVSARVLITELAPWSSLVQRFGRCNREGAFNAEGGADIYWVDLDYDNDKDLAPYTLAECQSARGELVKLVGSSVSPHSLSNIHVEPLKVIRPVIRKKDVVDLFDTTPDLAGHDLDIARYIREGDDNDVQVYWRNLSATADQPTDDTTDPARDELCRVAVYRFQEFLDAVKKTEDLRNVWLWDGLNEKWQEANRARPGAIYLLDHRLGGYNHELGWTGGLAKLTKQHDWTTPLPLAATSKTPDANGLDPLTHTGTPLSLKDHTQDVVDELQSILASLNLNPSEQQALNTAAEWHDAGKSLEEFQTMLRLSAGENAPLGLLAKSGHGGGRMPAHRRHFRHELASALAWLAHHDNEDACDLVAYIIAAHHGKVRLSIRSLPEEQPPKNWPEDTLIARGVLQGDVLPVIPNLTTKETTLSLDLMRMGESPSGRPSWLARMIALRDQLGPYHLAYVEMMLRAADMRASAKETKS